MQIAETERTIIRRMDVDDAAFMLQLLNSKGWLENIGDRGIKNIKDSIAYIKNKIISGYESDGYGIYAVVNKRTGETMGQTGLINRPGLKEVDIGFAMLPAFTRMGYCYEASFPIIQHAKDVGISKLVAITLPANLASRGLLEKLGMSFKKEFYMKGDLELLCFYELEL